MEVYGLGMFLLVVYGFYLLELMVMYHYLVSESFWCTSSPYAKILMRAAVEMHSCFDGWELSAESHDVIDSLWTLLQSRKNWAF